MPKHKDHIKGEGEKLAGSPKQFVELMIADGKAAEDALDQIINDGPPHKQVLSAMLLKKAGALMREMESKGGQAFTQQTGTPVMLKEHENEKPVVLINLNKEDLNAKGIVEAIEKAPEHEALAYLLAMQAIDWVTTQLKKIQSA